MVKLRKDIASAREENRWAGTSLRRWFAFRDKRPIYSREMRRLSEYESEELGLRHTSLSLIDLNIDLITTDVVEVASLYVYDVSVLESHQGAAKSNNAQHSNVIDCSASQLCLVLQLTSSHR